MLYPDDFESKIGFSQIREILYDACLSKLGREEVEKMAFSIDYQEIKQKQHQTEEFRQILLSADHFPSQDFYDTLPLLTHLRIENTYPEPDQLAEFRLALTTFLDILNFFNAERAEIYPNLSSLISKSEQRKANSEKRKAKSEQRTANSEQRTAKTIPHPISRISYPVSRI